MKRILLALAVCLGGVSAGAAQDFRYNLGMEKFDQFGNSYGLDGFIYILRPQAGGKIMEIRCNLREKKTETNFRVPDNFPYGGRKLDGFLAPSAQNMAGKEAGSGPDYKTLYRPLPDDNKKVAECLTYAEQEKAAAAAKAAQARAASGL